MCKPFVLRLAADESRSASLWLAFPVITLAETVLKRSTTALRADTHQAPGAYARQLLNLH
jgi:hypothetical protein